MTGAQIKQAGSITRLIQKCLYVHYLINERKRWNKEAREAASLLMPYRTETALRREAEITEELERLMKEE